MLSYYKGGFQLKQLHQQLKLQYDNNQDLTPMQDSLIFKYVFSDVANLNSGVKTFSLGDTTSSLSFTNVNYLFITSVSKFRVLFLNDVGQEITLETQQYAYVNLSTEKTFTLQQSQAADEEVTANYLSGNV